MSTSTKRRGRPVLDLTGQRFGKLTAEADTGRRQNGHAIWSCQCDCGRWTTVTSNALRKGNTRSCGCLHSEGFALHQAEYRGWFAGQVTA